MDGHNKILLLRLKIYNRSNCRAAASNLVVIYYTAQILSRSFRNNWYIHITQISNETVIKL